VALFIKVTSSPKNTNSATWLEDGENFAQQRDPQEKRIYVAVHNIQVIGEMNDHVIHNVASVSQDKDPLAPTQQEKSELQEEENCLVVFSAQDVCSNNDSVMHNMIPLAHPQQDIDLCSSRRKKPALRHKNFFLGINSIYTSPVSINLNTFLP
jgi:hypothetical protein